jgi:hypothetical protein
MHRVGVLQGTYLAVYVGGTCGFWTERPVPRACHFCTTGRNVGVQEERRKTIDDVVEVAAAARRESGVVFTHLNTGYSGEGDATKRRVHGLAQAAPFVAALRERVGGYIGVQAPPVPEACFEAYDGLIARGADHFSFCVEFEDPETFRALCPGKAETLGQAAFYRAMHYAARRLGRGRVAGEIIAGVEPIAATKRGIDRIVNAGAFPTVCIFRPTIGSEMEDVPPPDPEAMKEVFAYVYESCKRAAIPIGVLPIEVSLVVQPEEAEALTEPSASTTRYRLRNRLLRQIARPYVAWKLRPREAS